jgi:C4-dicarboxylate-specific signal transduction histidine kinase
MHSDSELLPLFTNLLLRHFNRRLQRSIDNKIKLQETLESLENTQQKLVEGEKMAVLGQLVAGVAHELNNPVAAILRGADTISKNLAIVLDQANSTSEPLLDLPSGFNTEKIFRNALTATPMSTAEVRQQVKSLDASIDDRQISKKIVQFGMAKPFFALGTSKPMNAEALRAAVNHVEPYYHLGSTLRSVNVCASRIADMVKSLKGYAREDDEKLHHVDIHVGIEDTLVIFENRLKHHDVEKHYAELPKVLCMPIALQQVWTNLVSNSLDAMSSSGKLTISTKLADVSNRKYVCVSFKDSGSGIPQNIIDTIFELNYTTKKEGNFGLGIGLSVCQQILAQHSGWIEVQSIEGEYTLMDVFLPIN